MLRDALLYLHILPAALWLGTALYWPGMLRRALAADLAQAPPALGLARLAFRLDLAVGLAVVVTGAVLSSPLNPVPVPPRIGIGIGLALLRLALLLALVRPALARISEAIAGADLEKARAAARAVPPYAGAAHLLWALALATMVL